MTGILYGLLSAAAFGLIPFFTLPMLSAGVSIETALVYRFGVATIVMGAILLVKGEALSVSRNDLFKLALLSGFYLFAVVAFFHSFRLLPSSVAATIQFLYPVMVMMIMIIFFNERFNWRVALAVGLGIGGVALLSVGADSAQIMEGEPTVKIETGHIGWGVFLSLLAGLGNSLYMVGIQVARIPHINGLVMTFYVMAFGALYSLGNALANSSFEWIAQPRELTLAIMLALVTAVLSNLTLIMSIKRVGSTIASILGAMEPVTAVCIGVLFFGEPFTGWLAGGLTLILCSVLLALFVPGR